ncbi:MAG: DUF4893 domain-containing protein [Phenylobacterium sp.]
MKTIATALAVIAVTASSAHAASGDWRQDARQADVTRLRGLDGAWAAALAEAQRGDARGLRGLGVLADPKAGLTRPQPGPGDYRCRTVKLGSGEGASGLPLVAYGWFKCRVALSPGGDLTLVKTTGSQRPMGNLYPDTARRLVYLGAVALAEERSAVYGHAPERDQIGVFERIGANRWRLVLPYPKFESTLDLVELTR